MNHNTDPTYAWSISSDILDCNKGISLVVDLLGPILVLDSTRSIRHIGILQSLPFCAPLELRRHSTAQKHFHFSGMEMPTSRQATCCPTCHCGLPLITHHHARDVLVPFWEYHLPKLGPEHTSRVRRAGEPTLLVPDQVCLGCAFRCLRSPNG